MKRNPVPLLIHVRLLCLFFCSLNCLHGSVYAGTCYRLTFDRKDTVDYKKMIVNNDDTVRLLSSLRYADLIKGSVYNAINPKYIANTYGVTLSHLGLLAVSFEIMQFNNQSDYLTAVNAAKTWNYIVDDVEMTGYKRGVVPILMLDAVETVEYSSSTRFKHVILSNTTEDTLLNAAGEIRIRTRPIPKEGIENRNTRYLLDDVEITHKIFNAINPVYIRSLERITDEKGIAGRGYDKCDEIVEVNLFTFDQVYAPGVRVITGDGGRQKIAIIDGVPMDPAVVEKLYRHHFKEAVYSTSKYDDAYSEYRKKYPGKTDFTIISL